MRAFRELAASPPADGSRLFLDGAHLVQDARAAGLLIERAAVSAKHVEDGSEVAGLAASLAHGGVDVLAVTDPVMRAMSPVRSPSGIVAIASRQPFSPAGICRHPHALIVAAMDVQDPGNLGALIRAAEAGGATGALVGGRSASPFSWKAVRGSMGSVLRLPIAAGGAPEALVQCAGRFGVRRVASVARDGQSPDAIDWRGPVMLVVGGEGAGLAERTLAACDARVTIPMAPPVESLNVAVAGALLVYEARRQRNLAP
ncbi:MAG: TrmH family RNA methyltransferase [Vicinamibacterales bacterium]